MKNPRIVSILCSATEIVSALGFGGNLVGRSHECNFPAGVHAGASEWAAIRTADPEVILVIPCGFGLTQIECDLPGLLARPGRAEMAAVKVGRVYIADQRQYFNRPGPRLAGSVEVLAGNAPSRNGSGRHENTAWQRLSQKAQ